MSFLRTISLILLTMTAMHTTMSQFTDVVNGYARYTRGEHLGYRSFHPYASASLLTRCLDGKSTIAWETDPVPQDLTGENVTFVWMAAHSSGTSGGDATFRLSVDGRDALQFTTVKERRVRQWKVTGNEGITLSFDAKWEDSVNDLYGYMQLTVPVRLVTKGKPLTLAITGENAGRRDWYMTFKYAIRDSIEVQPQPALLTGRPHNRQLIEVLFDILELSSTATISVPGQPPLETPLKLGFNRVQFTVDAVSAPTPMRITVARPGHAGYARDITLQPVPFRELWVIHHSHNDIGYSDLQVDVEKKQLKNLRDAVVLYTKTAHYPKEARFRWNSEIMWAVETYLRTAPESERKEFMQAVREGGIGLNGFYTNQLTGICRPEELIRLTDDARRIGALCGVTVKDAMINDIPGSTWATVTALAQAGIRYYSSGPNYILGLVGGGDRVGHFNKSWGDRPFYWVSASGQEKVLMWVAGHGYSAFHGATLGRSGGDPSTKVLEYMRELDDMHYPYDMVQLRYTIVADNGPTDPELPDFVKSWNEKYASPKFIISTTAGMFEEFERRWGGTLPTFAGDITPYWEDGALSSLRELALVRRSSERLVQAEAVSCMTGAPAIPVERWDEAWRTVHLGSEHTWGAHNSVSDPDNPFAVEQWRVKKGFMEDADARSRALMTTVLGQTDAGDVIDVINTASWDRTDLVVLTREQSAAGDVVSGPDGRTVPSQRLASGDLAFVARNVPALGSTRFTLKRGTPSPAGSVRVTGNMVTNGLITATIDRTTGAISSLTDARGFEYVKAGSGQGLNQYLYVPGKDPATARTATVTKIEAVEQGGLVGIIRVTSVAPGCRSLVQEYRVTDGLARIEMVNRMDKEKVREKESVHFAFPANPADGTFRLDGGWGIVRPTADQLPGSCVEYLSTGRWMTLANQEQGLTWTTVETPLVQVGALVNEAPDDHGLRQWRKDIIPGSTFYSYAMNNYWHTNYLDAQPGPVSVSYALFPHGMFNAVDGYRRGVELNQPLLVRRATAATRRPATLFALSSPGIVATSVKPATDGKAVIIRLFNAGGKPEEFRVLWKDLKPSKVYVSSVFEGKDAEAGATLTLPAFGILTLRCETR